MLGPHQVENSTPPTRLEGNGERAGPDRPGRIIRMVHQDQNFAEVNPVPPLNPEEREDLTRSILENGVIVPVLKSAGPACKGQIVDGFHRTEIAAQLKVPCPEITKEYLSEEQFKYDQIEANLNRRQLSIAQRIMLGMRIEPLERMLAKQRMSGIYEKQPEEGTTREIIGRKLGMSGATYQRGKKILEEGSEELIELFLTGSISVNEGWRRLKNLKRLENVDRIVKELENIDPIPEGPFDVMVIDPPWPVGPTPYPQMQNDEIEALPIMKMMNPDSIVWLWCMNTNIAEAVRIAGTWEYKIVSMLTWDKGSPSPAWWMFSQTEHALMLVKGKPLYHKRGQATLMKAPKRGHSAKPDAFYEMVENNCPGTKVEMFARKKRPGWAAWGAEA